MTLPQIAAAAFSRSRSKAPSAPIDIIVASHTDFETEVFPKMPEHCFAEKFLPPITVGCICRKSDQGEGIRRSYFPMRTYSNLPVMIAWAYRQP